MNQICVFTLIASLAAVTGCASNTVADVSCSMPNAEIVEDYVDSASAKLDSYSCATSFDSLYSELIEIGKENPSEDNKAQFARLIRSGIDSGAISTKHGKQLFNEYFESEFYALKTDVRSNCTALREREVFVSQMEEELGRKKVGMLDVMGDEDGFRLSQRYFTDLTTVMDAVAYSCESSLARR